MHFSKSHRIEETQKLIITEGALKAQVVTAFDEYIEDSVLGLAGVASFQESIGADLRAIFPMLA